MRPARAVVLAEAGLGLVRGEATRRRLGRGDEDGGDPGPEVTCTTVEAAVPVYSFKRRLSEGFRIFG